MKFGVVVFPGSNCDHDAYHVVSKHVGQPVDFIWHKETNLRSFDAVIVPGGFSYGDYLRAGALAAFSPVMQAIKDFAADGKFVFGGANVLPYASICKPQAGLFTERSEVKS